MSAAMSVELGVILFTGAVFVFGWVWRACG
jgi:hypothetical protein